MLFLLEDFRKQTEIIEPVFLSKCMAFFPHNLFLLFSCSLFEVPFFKSYTCHLGDKMASTISLMSWLKCAYQTICIIMFLGPLVSLSKKWWNIFSKQKISDKWEKSTFWFSVSENLWVDLGGRWVEERRVKVTPFWNSLVCIWFCDLLATWYQTLCFELECIV